jgi:hypothetical protein
VNSNILKIRAEQCILNPYWSQAICCDFELFIEILKSSPVLWFRDKQRMLYGVLSC